MNARPGLYGWQHPAQGDSRLLCVLRPSRTFLKLDSAHCPYISIMPNHEALGENAQVMKRLSGELGALSTSESVMTHSTADVDEPLDVGHLPSEVVLPCSSQDITENAARQRPVSTQHVWHGAMSQHHRKPHHDLKTRYNSHTELNAPSDNATAWPRGLPAPLTPPGSARWKRSGTRRRRA